MKGKKKKLEEIEYVFPSISLRPEDLERLCREIRSVLSEKEKGDTTCEITLWGNSFRERCLLENFRSREGFRRGLEVVEVIAHGPSAMDVHVLLSARAQPPSNPHFSRLSAKTRRRESGERIVAVARALSAERRTYNSIFHVWGIPIANVGAQALMLLIYLDINVVFGIPGWSLAIGALAGGVLSFSGKHLLRWAYPFIEFVGSSELREFVRIALLVVVGAVSINALWILWMAL